VTQVAGGGGGSEAFRSLGGGGDVKIGQSLHFFLWHGEGLSLEEAEVFFRGLVAFSISDRLAGRLYVMDGGWGKILVVEELFLRMG
jgi:hypothetical protein